MPTCRVMGGRLRSATSEPSRAGGRAEYYADQPATVSTWDESAVRFRGLWAEYQRRWPAEE